MNRDRRVTITVGLQGPGRVAATADTSAGTLAAGTYRYVVTAVMSDSAESNTSTRVSATVAGGTDQIVLRWNPVPGAASYKIYRGTTNLRKDSNRVETPAGPPATFTDDGTKLPGSRTKPPS